MEAVTDFLFLGSQTTADGDCSHEMKGCLLLDRKAMTNLDNMLKSRDITLLTNIHIVKANSFPVVMYRSKSQTVKKTCQRIDAFELWCWRRFLRVSWTTRRPNHQSILKEIDPEYSLEGLMLKLMFQYFSHLIKRVNSWEKTMMLGKIEGSSRRRQPKMR